MPTIDCPNCRESLGEVEAIPGQTVRCPSCDVLSCVVPPLPWGERVIPTKYVLMGTVVPLVIGLAIAYWEEFLKLLCIGVVMLVMAGVLLAPGGRRYSTLRPLNGCGRCGHTWYPRGTNYSRRCPACGAAR